MKTSQLYYFAQAYGQGTYNGCNYNNSVSCATTSGSGGSSSTAASNGNSGLANTGIAVGLIVGVACLIVFAALVVRFWRRGKRPAEPVSETVEETDDDQQS